MYSRDVLSLITYTTTENAIGDIIETPVLTQVFCNKKSVRQSEFYQAMANGLRPEAMFEIRLIDYSNQDKLSFEGVTYEILRTYDRDGEMIELVCNRLVNG